MLFFNGVLGQAHVRDLWFAVGEILHPEDGGAKVTADEVVPS